MLPERSGGDDLAERQALGVVARQALTRLSGQQRAVLVLRYWADLPEAEAAAPASQRDVYPGWLMAGAGSAVNDLVRELGGAFGIGVLGSLTLAQYRDRLAPAVASHPMAAADSVRAGLAQALVAGGGPGSPLGVTARHAYAAGLDLGMLAGAGCAAVAAVVVCLGLRASRATLAPSTVAALDPASHRELDHGRQDERTAGQYQPTRSGPRP